MYCASPFLCVCVLCFQMFVTFSAVFGVVVYRICMLSVWSMNPDPEAKARVRMTVITTGIVLNMLVVLVLEEVYGAIAVWLTELGNVLNIVTKSIIDKKNQIIPPWVYFGVRWATLSCPVLWDIQYVESGFIK